MPVRNRRLVLVQPVVLCEMRVVLDNATREEIQVGMVRNRGLLLVQPVVLCGVTWKCHETMSEVWETCDTL